MSSRSNNKSASAVLEAADQTLDSTYEVTGSADLDEAPAAEPAIVGIHANGELVDAVAGASDGVDELTICVDAHDRRLGRGSFIQVSGTGHLVCRVKCLVGSFENSARRFVVRARGHGASPL